MYSRYCENARGYTKKFGLCNSEECPYRNQTDAIQVILPRDKYNTCLTRGLKRSLAKRCIINDSSRLETEELLESN